MNDGQGYETQEKSGKSETIISAQRQTWLLMKGRNLHLKVAQEVSVLHFPSEADPNLFEVRRHNSEREICLSRHRKGQGILISQERVIYRKNTEGRGQIYPRSRGKP